VYTSLPSGISGSSNNTSRTSREIAPTLLGLWERVGSAGRPVSGNGVAHEQLARAGRTFSAGNADCYAQEYTQTYVLVLRGLVKKFSADYFLL